MITITGPTASGKTRLATALAYCIGSEIISADSRQVYKGMDIGTGKDLSDYTINGQKIPYHLIDILPAGAKYNLFSFQKDFYQVYNELIARQIEHPILCGGTGMYIESILRHYQLADVAPDKELRDRLDMYDHEQLSNILKSYGPLHNTTDISSKQRCIRAIEIAHYSKAFSHSTTYNPPIISGPIFCINIDREERRKKITQRLLERIDNGLIEEVDYLLKQDISPEDLIYYGLEYKFVTLYLIGSISKQEMIKQLEIAIHQFAKRQMTWFRGMERRGLTLHYIDALAPREKQLNEIKDICKQYNIYI